MTPAPTPTPLTLDDVKFRTIEDDMTLDELRLYDLGRDHWGDEVERVQRGALYLDRVIPDWYERVEVNSLRLEFGCSCVLGQIFQPAAVQADSDTIVGRSAAGRLRTFAAASRASLTGWTVGCASLGLRGDALAQSDAPATFFGFDYGGDHLPTWDVLTATWRTEITARKEAAAR